MDGWIIKNSKGQYLVKSSQWRPNREPIALFFSEEELEALRGKAKEAKVETSDLILLPAQFDNGIIRARNGWAREF